MATLEHFLNGVRRAPTENPATPGRLRTRLHAALPLAVLAAVLVVMAVSLVSSALARKPMSIVDEHTHFDYAVQVADGHLPHRGSLYSQTTVREWACGVGHEAGRIRKSCDDPSLSAADLPTGKYTTGYIHYPTYFVALNGWRAALDAVGLTGSRISQYRSGSAVLFLLGIVVWSTTVWRRGFRGTRHLAATLLPVAAAGLLYSGTYVTPSSTAILTGALVAGTGIRWVATGRGVAGFLAATLFASIVAVTDSLAAVPFLLAAVGCYLAQRSGRLAGLAWRPKIRDIALLAAALVGPVVAWGQYIRVTATISDATLYAGIPRPSLIGLLPGLGSSLGLLHTPWYDVPTLFAVQQGHPFRQTLRAIAGGTPTWVTVLAVGGLLVLAVSRRTTPSEVPSSATTGAETRVRGEAQGWGEPSSRSATVRFRILGGCAIATLALFPVALRASNYLNFGTSFPIVARYSAALAPLLSWLVLRLADSKWLDRGAAVLAVTTVLGLSVWY